ncbi:MAG: transglutaminaseTgpA domain-containing protein [Acidimicrobiales bacterium]
MTVPLQAEQRAHIVALRASTVLMSIAAVRPSANQWMVALACLGVGMFGIPQPRRAPAPRWVLGMLGLALIAASLQRTATHQLEAVLVFSTGLMLAGWMVRGRALGSAAASISLLGPAIMEAVSLASARQPTVSTDTRWMVGGFATMLVTRLVAEFSPDPIPMPRIGRTHRPLAQPLLLLPIMVAVMVAAVGGAAVANDALPDSNRRPPSLQWSPGQLGGDTLRSHPGLSGRLDAGDTPTLDDEVVLRVRSERALYWRGMTYGDYDGRYWTDSGRTQEFITPAGTLELQPGTSPIGSERLLQTFTVERAGLDVFLAADRMEVLHFDGFEGTWGINDNSIRPTRPLAAGAQWTVESAIIPVDAAQLRAADQFPQLVPPSVLRQYGAENDVSSATADLAEAITADAVTTYDKVLALEAWFADNVSYRQDVPAAPAGVDPVDRLLFDVNEGYCEQIASAMTVMLRSLGVPARIAVGYVPGEFDATTGEWLSRGTDAHAWTEVYFAGIGWQGFDPTAKVPLAGEQDPDSLAGTSVPWRLVGLLVACVLAAGLITWLVTRRHGNARLPSEVERLNRIGRSLGIEWPPSATLRERLDALATHGIDTAAISAARTAIEAAEFGADHEPAATSHALDALELAAAGVAKP